MTDHSNTYSYQQIRADLLERREIALLYVGEEAPFAEGHPLFAANLPLSRLEIEAARRLPNREVTIVVYDDNDEVAPVAVKRLAQLGYKHVHLLEGGLAAWIDAGGELFKDVNSPSKAFGELVEAKRHTPSLSAAEVKSLIDDRKDIVILDARRYDEYNTMNIPTGISVPGAELVLRAKQMAPRSETTIIVNCAGRTRSIIGTQSLINAGVSNPVFALRNGTIGWTLAGQKLEHGQTRKHGETDGKNHEEALASAKEVATRADVKYLNYEQLAQFKEDDTRTTYFFDVRSVDEYLEGHLPGFLSAQGGQLVQETDHFAPVRGARIILTDDNGVRANMTASWLAQMAWEVYVLDEVSISSLTERDEPHLDLPLFPLLNAGQLVSTKVLNHWLQKKESVTVIDLATVRQYEKQHIPGAWYVLRSQLSSALKNLPVTNKYVLTSPDGMQARFAITELQELINAEIYLLEGGTNAWVAGGYQMEIGELNNHFASVQIDRYRRPYEGTNNSAEAMQAYLDWEYGLVAQLERDGTHGFFVI